jgi:hypothetical protein
VLLRLPSASAIYPEGHHVVVRGHCRVLDPPSRDEPSKPRDGVDQLIVNDPAIGERFLSREELVACRSRVGRPFHAFIARTRVERATKTARNGNRSR